jgi:signal transduction histidine kinase
MVTADGRDFLAAVSTVHTSDGQAIGRVAVLQDVTDLKEVDRLKSEFLDGISHDLRSPLTYMRNYAGLLPLPEDPALEQEYVNKIVTGIDRMSVWSRGCAPGRRTVRPRGRWRTPGRGGSGYASPA